jgi:hypothetical protein
MTHKNDDYEVDGLIDWAMRIAKENAVVKAEMKQAIQAGRLRDALLCACKLAGIEPTDAVKSLQDPTLVEVRQ